MKMRFPSFFQFWHHLFDPETTPSVSVPILLILAHSLQTAELLNDLVWNTSACWSTALTILIVQEDTYFKTYSWWIQFFWKFSLIPLSFGWVGIIRSGSCRKVHRTTLEPVWTWQFLRGCQWSKKKKIPWFKFLLEIKSGTKSCLLFYSSRDSQVNSLLSLQQMFLYSCKNILIVLKKKYLVFA